MALTIKEQKDFLTLQIGEERGKEIWYFKKTEREDMFRAIGVLLDLKETFGHKEKLEKK